MRETGKKPSATLLHDVIEALPLPVLVLEQDKNKRFSVVMGNASAWEVFACTLTSPENEITGVLECLKDLPHVPAGEAIEVREQLVGREWRVHAAVTAAGRTRRYVLSFFGDEKPQESPLRLTGGILSDMSHELRTPLNAIIGFSELMQNEVFGPLANEQYRDYVGGIRESGLSLLSTINDVLNLAAPAEAERGDVCDLANLLRLAVEVYEPRFRKIGASVAAMVPTQPVAVQADSGQLEQGLFCLLDSSLRLMPEHSGISVALALDDATRSAQVTLDLLPRPSMCRRSGDQPDYHLFNEQSVSFSLAKKCFRLQGGDMAVGRSESGIVSIRITLPCNGTDTMLPHSSDDLQKKVALSS